MIQKYKAKFVQQGIVSSLLILLGLMFVFIFFSVAVGQLIVGNDIHSIRAVKTFQLLQSIGLFWLPPLLYAYFCTSDPCRFLGTSRRPQSLTYIWVIVFVVLAVPAINLVTQFNQELALPDAFRSIESWMKSTEMHSNELMKSMMGVRGVQALCFNVFLMAFVPAVGEELFFRASLIGIFQKKWSIHGAIWFSAIIFSTIHFQFYGFLPRMLLGAFFGYLFVWSGSLALVILAHFVNNLLVVLFYYLRFNGSCLIDLDSIGTGSTLGWGIGSMILCIVGIVFFYFRFRPSQE